GKVKTTPLFDMGGTGIESTKGFVRFFPFSASNLPQRVPQQAKMGFSMHDLPGGGVLIGAQNGLFMSPAPALANAAVRPITDLRQVVVNPNPVEVRVSFSHACAPEAGNLGLTLVSMVDGTERARELVHHLLDPS